MFRDREVVKQSERFVRLHIHKSVRGNRELMNREKYEVPRCPWLLLLKPSGEIHEVVLKREEVVEKEMTAEKLAERLKKCADDFDEKK